MSFPSITNRSEYFSEHYLEALVQGDLKDLRGHWETSEAANAATPRRALRGLGTQFFRYKAEAAEGNADALRELHDALLAALGFPRVDEIVEGTHGEALAVELPVAHAVRTDTGLALVVLEGRWAADVDDALSEEGALPAPPTVDGQPLAAPAQAIAAAFALDDPPAHVLLLAGAVAVLATREKWAEGRFLAVDIDGALGRMDVKAKGELETVAALFSRDALIASGPEAEALIDRLGKSSNRQAVAVSKDLREGVRLSVQDLANEIVDRTLEKKLAVYDEPDIEKRLTRESLRFLYRILFLLFAEARPELGILPTTAEGYEEGYGLDRLRELVLADLTTERARRGSHLHDSLDLLFRLVNQGYHHDHAQQQFVSSEAESSYDTGLIFEPMQSDLFGSRATGLIDRVRLGNDVLQRVLSRLLLTPQKKGHTRQFVSYSTLGINQLGAVYEGLMAYTGSLAKEDLYEVRVPGKDPEDGTWVVPVARADRYPEESFVEHANEDGRPATRVCHPRGSFVFRLSGRDRERSASYYTPEALTRCVVQHALAELLDQNGETTAADSLLELAVCEPALGSGAFLNEAVRQLAEEYLRRKEAELGEVIEPNAYNGELQRVKSHLALHQCYGVDLNPTAVELAEVSLWLGAMHRGLQAPWFGLHLRRGNSLVGARRTTYKVDQLVKGSWTAAAPMDRPLSQGGIDSDEVHHFLLPAAGWGSVGDAQQAKELDSKAAESLRTWRRHASAAVASADAARLRALAGRVEALWKPAIARLELAERDLRRDIRLWGQPQVTGGGARVARDHVQRAMEDDNSALARLRLVMNAWCALWFWPLDAFGASAPPGREEWISTMEDILGLDLGEVTLEGQLDFGMTLDELTALERRLAAGGKLQPVSEVIEAHPWLKLVIALAEREGFFHWELEFGNVFKHGGFDLQVGNPPWVRPEWSELLTLAEVDPWFAITPRLGEKELSEKREELLSDPESRAAYSADVGVARPTSAFLSDATARPIMAGLHTNLYLLFVDLTWSHRAPNGVVGLLHPSGHFTDPAGALIREASYRRLRRLWHFVNQAKLFAEIGNTRPFAVAIYGIQREVSFDFISNLHVPETIQASLDHNGEGAVPGPRTTAGQRDRSGHRERVLRVDGRRLDAWCELFDPPGTPPARSRLVFPFVRADADALDTFAASPRRLQDLTYYMSRGFDEKGAKVSGVLRWDTHDPGTWEEAILQGPHAWVALPFYKYPNDPCRNHRDYSPWVLEALPERVVPRTNFRIASSRETYEAALDYWDGRPATDYWRLFFSRRVDPAGERTLQPAVIPPGPSHVDVSNTLHVEGPRQTVFLAGLWASLVMDFLVKVSGKDNVRDELVRRFPVPESPAWETPLLLRTLRLNCLTRDYEALWQLSFEPDFAEDSFTSDDGRLPPLGGITRDWTMATPLRRDLDRRQALVELDALGALIVGLSADQLCAMYKTQFSVLRKYEHSIRFDQEGRRVPIGIVLGYENDPRSIELSRFAPPFTKPDREAEMRRAYATFEARMGAAAR